MIFLRGLFATRLVNDYSDRLAKIRHY